MTEERISTYLSWPDDTLERELALVERRMETLPTNSRLYSTYENYRGLIEAERARRAGRDE